MRTSAIIAIAAAAVAVSALALTLSMTQTPAPVEEALITPSPVPLTQYTFEGDTDSQLFQALQALMYDHGYSGVLSGPDLTGRLKLTTRAPQPIIDAVFDSIDVELTVVEGEIVGQ